MRLPRRDKSLVAAGLVASQVARCLFAADSVSNPPASPDQSVTIAASALPSRLLRAKSPVDSFRELLAMDDAERDRFLANRPPETRERILAKLREYEEFTPDERELRLRATELRWYLVPLLSSPLTNRTAQLEHIPAELRKLVEDRLEQWNLLPPPLQKEFLENDQTLSLYLQLEASTPAQRKVILDALPAAKREEVEEGFEQRRLLPVGAWQETLGRLDQLIDLTPEERSKALNTLSEAERRQIEKTLRTFETLPKTQRARCIRAFAKFATLSAEERQQFLKNAARWQAMTPAERQEWRDLVKQIPIWPPEPWEMTEPPPRTPPPFPPNRISSTLTNGN